MIAGSIHFTLSTAVANLTVTALDAFASVDAHDNRNSELHVCRIGEFERTEFGIEKIAVDRIEIFEQERIHGTSVWVIQKIMNMKRQSKA